MNILKRKYLFILFLCILLGLERNAFAHGGAEALIPLGIFFVVIVLPVVYFTDYFIGFYKIKYIFRNPEEKKRILSKGDIAVTDVLILSIGIFGPILLFFIRSIFSVTVAKYHYLISYLLICLLFSFIFNINLIKEKSVSLTEFLKNRKNIFRTILMSLPIILIISLLGIFSIFVLGILYRS